MGQIAARRGKSPQDLRVCQVKDNTHSIPMEKISEEPLPAETETSLKGSIAAGLELLKLDKTAAPQTVVDAIDAFVDAWQEGKRPPKSELDPEDAPYILAGVGRHH
jgi:hypothetical protein